MKPEKQKTEQIKPQIDTGRQEKYFNCFVIGILIILSFYQSYILFGHKIVPISDFSAFVQTGHEILSFKYPTDFKRGPVTGILQILFGKLAGGRFPDLRGGWLLNSVLHP